MISVTLQVGKAELRFYYGCKITYLATYLIWVHFIFKLSHVANGTIPFQVKDWSRMFAHLLLHLFLWKTNKTQLDVLLGLLASYYEGTESKATCEL